MHVLCSHGEYQSICSETSRDTNHSQNFTKPITVNICPVHYEVLPSKPTDCCHMEKQKPETAASAEEAT